MICHMRLHSRPLVARFMRSPTQAHTNGQLLNASKWFSKASRALLSGLQAVGMEPVAIIANIIKYSLLEGRFDFFDISRGSSRDNKLLPLRCGSGWGESFANSVFALVFLRTAGNL